jgi:hydrogenase-4 component B
MSLKLAIPFAIFALAMTGGIAIATFVKAYGITFLGLHRSQNSKHAHEVNHFMKIGMVLMTLFIASLMLFAPKFLHSFDAVVISLGLPSVYAQIFPDSILSMHSIGVHGGIVSPLILFIALFGVTSLLLFAYKVLGVKERIYHTWGCGYKTSAKTEYTATGYSGVMRRFFNWLYKPEEHISKQHLAGHTTKFSDAHYAVHIKPLFERSLYENSKRVTNIISYWVYRLAHFEQTRYPAMIFNLMLFILFSYRVFTNDVNWESLMIESAMMIISIKILVIGEKK